MPTPDKQLSNFNHFDIDLLCEIFNFLPLYSVRLINHRINHIVESSAYYKLVILPTIIFNIIKKTGADDSHIRVSSMFSFKIPISIRNESDQLKNSISAYKNNFRDHLLTDRSIENQIDPTLIERYKKIIVDSNISSFVVFSAVKMERALQLLSKRLLTMEIEIAKQYINQHKNEFTLVYDVLIAKQHINKSVSVYDVLSHPMNTLMILLMVRIISQDHQLHTHRNYNDTTIPSILITKTLPNALTLFSTKKPPTNTSSSSPAIRK